MPIPSPLNILKLLCKYPGYITHLTAKKLRFGNRYGWVKKNAGSGKRLPAPLAYKLLLTWKCNLHCKICMLWGDAGNLKEVKNVKEKEEMKWKHVEKVLNRAAHGGGSLILSGGEPLMYSHFDALMASTKKAKCFSTICTNGTLLKEHEEAIINNPYAVLLVSLDGPEEENDAMRGEGVYKRVTGAIKDIKKQRNSPYLGVQYTIRPENVRKMYEFCREMVALNVDWILLNLCWFVTEVESKNYAERLCREFNVKPASQRGYMMPYGLDADEFARQYKMIEREKWPMQISCYLKRPEHMRSYVNSRGEHIKNGFCYKQWMRMDVMPDGSITPCAQFPDICVGNMDNGEIDEIWNSVQYNAFRQSISRNLLPVCKKCDCLYLYDSGRKYL